MAQGLFVSFEGIDRSGKTTQARLLVDALGASSYASPEVTAWGLGRGLLVGVAIGVLGGLYPAWRVSRLDPGATLARS